MIIRRLVNSIRLARAISMLRQGNLDRSDKILATLRFKGFYQSLALSMRAYIALIRTDPKKAVQFLEASGVGCAKSDHADARYIAMYNDYLSAAIADDPDRFAAAWHSLQAAPSSQPVRDALFVARLPSPNEVKSFSRRPMLH